jgi:hypothetical protein
MGRRIEVELTSSRDDGSWTWRAAGARQPKGELVGSLLYDGAKVGDVVKVDAEFHVDGIEVVEVYAPKRKKERADLLELKSRQWRDDELVTTQRVNRNERRGRRGRNRERDGRSRPRDDGNRRPENRRERRESPVDAPPRPKPKRLRPKRVHRDALLTEVAEEHRPIVEQVIRDGMPGVRAAIDKQNAEAKAAGKPEIDAAPILAIAEKNLAKARLAEWRDRADAALENATELDLRDLRSVVVAGNDIARDPESREVADRLKAALDERVEADHAQWLSDLEVAITDGRVVRALRLSSRPVKAGAPLPSDLASTLAGQASDALAPDVGQERWATVLDALAFSPVRGAVTPVGLPEQPRPELLDAVKRLADRLPTIAGLFSIDPATVPKPPRRRRPSSRKPDAKAGTKPNTKTGSKAGTRPKTESAAPTGGGGKGRAEEQAAESELPAAGPRPTTEPAAGETPVMTSEPATADEPGSGAPTATEAPSTEAPPAAEATSAEAPSAEAPSIEAPSAEAPPGEAPPAEAPPAEAPSTEAPPAAEAPSIEAPSAEAPSIEAPSIEATSAEATSAEAPPGEAPPAEAPSTEAPPAAEAPATEAIPAEVNGSAQVDEAAVDEPAGSAATRELEPAAATSEAPAQVMELDGSGDGGDDAMLDEEREQAGDQIEVGEIS